MYQLPIPVTELYLGNLHPHEIVSGELLSLGNGVARPKQILVHTQRSDWWEFYRGLLLRQSLW